MLRGLRDVRLASDQARDHGAGDQAARDHDVARAALDDAARDDAALDHDLRAGRDAGHHLLGALHTTRVCGQHRPCGCARLELLCSVYLVLRRRAAPIYCTRTAERKQRAIARICSWRKSSGYYLMNGPRSIPITG